MFRNRCVMAFCFLLMMTTGAMQVWGEPEDLPKSKIRAEVMNEPGKAKEFLQSAMDEFNKNMKEAVESGRISKEAPESGRAEMVKQLLLVLQKSDEFRKTLKEPEHRLLLDMEMLKVAGQAQKPEKVMEIIKQWKGEARDNMTIVGVQILEQSTLPIPAEMAEFLKEASKSSEAKVAEFARRYLDPFRLNPVGQPFPAFPGTRTTTDGKPLSLDRFKGKVLLVDFWATWCPPCRAEVPNLVKAYETYNSKGFEIVGISYDQERSKFDEYLKEQKMSWPQYFDGKGWENEVGPTYSIKSIPAMYLLDREGKVVSRDLRGGNLEKELAKLFK